MNQLDLSTILQILLDIGLFCFLALLLRGRQKIPKGPEELVQKLERIVADANEAAAAFDANLEERKNLIQNIIYKLDERLVEAEKICGKLAELKLENKVQMVPHNASPKFIDHDKVLHLAQKGFDAQAIAKRLQKPLGEVQLILNLKRLSTGP